MTPERYPVDTQITPEDFEWCGWKEILGGTSREGYPAMSHAFSQAAKEIIDEGRLSHGKVLWLLADACSMMLRPDSINQPFRPMIVIDGKRSALPEDFSDEDIEFFAQIVDSVDDAWLRARLADLVWLRQQKRDVRFALAAIDAYREVSLDTTTWIRGGRECWTRAIMLARMLGRGAGDRLNNMESAITRVLLSATLEDGFLAFWLAELLRANKLGRVDATAIAEKLKVLAGQFDSREDYHQAREYFGAAAKWFSTADDEANAVAMTVSQAEGWVKEAEARLSSNNPSHMVATAFYENAIQTYRTIPHKERPVYHVDERISELRAHLNESGQKALGEMSRVQTGPVDITKIVEQARNEVRGKPIREALLAFCNLETVFNVAEAREQAMEILRQSPLLGLVSMNVVSRDGRIIAKPPGMSFDGTGENDEAAIKVQMIRQYQIHVGLIVQGMILPALEILRLEHRVSENDFVWLASQSSIVPRNRIRLFGKALFEGYDGDFIAALHILVPQIEHMVRHHLKQVGVQTTTLDSQGIETEIGMSALMERPEAKEIFGADLHFELQTLFCDSLGPNLRNEIAHGLIDDNEILSTYSIYAWWLSLKLVFNTFWNTVMEPQRENDTSGDAQ